MYTVPAASTHTATGRLSATGDAFTVTAGLTAEELKVEEDRVARLRWVLNQGGVDDGAPSRVCVMLKTFEREPNLEYVRNWKTVYRPSAPADAPLTLTVGDLVAAGAAGGDTFGAVGGAVGVATTMNIAEAEQAMEQPAPAPAC